MMTKNSFYIKTLLTVLTLTVHVYLIAQKSAASFDRQPFYAALSSNNSQKIDEQLDLVKKTSIPEKTGFEGALLMKKAGIISGPGKKLNIFKEGNKKLEGAISKDANNAEYRFLRLIIQENAPGVLGYNDHIKKDSEFVRQSYKTLPGDVQQAIMNYSKTSKSLRVDDL